MKFKRIIGCLLLLLTLQMVACGAEASSPKGEWRTQDGALVIRFDDLTGVLTREDGTQVEIDVLYSVSLGNIAFYSGGTELFLGYYTVEENGTVMIVKNAEMKEIYRLQKQGS